MTPNQWLVWQRMSTTQWKNAIELKANKRTLDVLVRKGWAERDMGVADENFLAARNIKYRAIKRLS